MTTTADLAIIGGGIVGLATAMTLSQRHSLSIVVMEAEAEVARHQTGHNSGVIHSGLYYKPGSQKARNCVEGRKALIRFCQEQNIPFDLCGKVVVAVEEREVSALEELFRRGEANGLSGLRQLNSSEIKEYEPNVQGVAGLWVPETGIIDYAQVAQTYGKIFESKGGKIHLQARLKKVTAGSPLTLHTTAGDWHVRYLINCGGLQADRVARMCGLDPGLHIVPFRGEYYQLVPEKRHLVKGLIYPVPDPQFPFLGVHFTRTVHGEVEAGPNAVLALSREGYSWGKISIRDLLEYAGYIGFWKMAAKYWRTGIGEMRRSVSKHAFFQALHRLMPCLKYDDIRPYGAGVRAQALGPSGSLIDDFHFVSTDKMVHVLNAPSPAATASLSVGASVAEVATKQFGW